MIIFITLVLAPNTLCVLCNLDYELPEHLFKYYHKAMYAWNLINNNSGVINDLQEGINSVEWLCHPNNAKSLYVKSIIEPTVWYIWKTQCDCIFKHDTPDFHLLSKKII